MTRTASTARSSLALLTALWISCAIAPAAAADAEPATDEPDGWLPVDLTVRLTQGGLDESRDPDEGALGGGQLALDVRLGQLPLWVSLAGEYYKKRPDALESWEINDLQAVYLLYKTERLPRLRSELCAGVGVGRLTTGTGEKAAAYEVTTGINRQLYKRLGLWVDVRYLYSRKEHGQERVVDFGNRGLLVGFTWNTGW